MHYELAQYDEAQKHYDMAIRAGAEPTHYYNSGLCKMKLDKISEAIDDFTKAIGSFSSDATEELYNSRFNRGVCHRRLGNLQRSIDDFRKAIETKADRPSAFNNLGLSLFENGEFEDALTNYGLAIKLDRSAVHYNNSGLANYHVDRMEEAKQDFDVAIEKDPREASYYFNRGNVFLNW